MSHVFISYSHQDSDYAHRLEDPLKRFSSWTRDSYYDSPEFDHYPVIYVNWYQAQTYARWVGGRLPTEAEWEYAARGPGRYVYPWGNEWDARRCNTLEGDKHDTTRVGSYPDGRSWCGALDLCGNVWEWTQSLYKAYPYNAMDGREDPDAEGARALRGGSWSHNQGYARCPARRSYGSEHSTYIDGFRCVVPISSAL